MRSGHGAPQATRFYLLRWLVLGLGGGNEAARVPQSHQCAISAAMRDWGLTRASRLVTSTRIPLRLPRGSRQIHTQVMNCVVQADWASAKNPPPICQNKRYAQKGNRMDHVHWPRQ